MAVSCDLAHGHRLVTGSIYTVWLLSLEPRSKLVEVALTLTHSEEVSIPQLLHWARLQPANTFRVLHLLELAVSLDNRCMKVFRVGSARWASPAMLLPYTL